MANSVTLKAAESMDWEQVICNGGPPCFHIDKSGAESERFCGRAQRWDGHGVGGRAGFHRFISLADLLRSLEGTKHG